MRCYKNAGKTGKRSWRSGILSGKTYERKLGGTSVNGRPLTTGDKILWWEQNVPEDVALSAEYVTFYETHAAYILPQRAELLVGSDGKLPLRLFYMEFTGNRGKIALDFHLSGDRGAVPDKSVVERSADGARLFTDPADPEKRTVFCFGVKNEKSCALVQGVFLNDRAGVFYKALEKYGTPESVREAILSNSRAAADKIGECRHRDLLIEEWAASRTKAEDRLVRAALLSDKYPEIASNEIRFACANQEIDGSGAGDGLLPLSILSYLNAGGGEEFLREELPYRQNGAFTKKRETVFWHAMRASVYARTREGIRAAEKLCAICGQKDLGKTFSEKAGKKSRLSDVLAGADGGRLSGDRALFCQSVLRDPGNFV